MTWLMVVVTETKTAIFSIREDQNLSHLVNMLAIDDNHLFIMRAAVDCNVNNSIIETLKGT